MKKRTLAWCIMLVAMAAAAVLLVKPKLALSQQLTLKFGSVFTEASELGSAPAQFLRLVEERTKGRIKFQRFWGGTLVSPREVVDSCGKGVVDVVNGLWIYDPGKLPLGNYDNNFFFNDPDVAHQAAIKREMYEKIPAMNEELGKFNIAPALCFFPMTSYDFLSRVPLKTLEDFRGKRVAHTPVEYTPAFKSIGAVSVISPVGGFYGMIERGVVDACSVPTALFDMMKIQEVAKYHTTAGFCSPVVMSLWINQDTWNRLSAKDKKLFIEVGKEADQLYIKIKEVKLKEAFENFKKAGVQLFTLSDADKAKWSSEMPDLPAEWAKKMEEKGLPGWKVVDTYIELSAKYGWKFSRHWGKR